MKLVDVTVSWPFRDLVAVESENFTAYIEDFLRDGATMHHVEVIRNSDHETVAVHKIPSIEHGVDYATKKLTYFENEG